MRQTLSAFFTRTIEYSFYALFLLVPLVFTSTTSELFEFNKMWLTFGISWIIVAAWTAKMIANKRFFIQKTPLDIPIGLFLLAYFLSTIFSIDPHISFWGYYSRFNGGFYSILTYIVLYYAFVTNFLSSEAEKISPVVMRSLIISVVSATIVALWGLPSHFGYDPTCLLFRGTFDVSCWTEAFQPKIRIFSTLGQPNWLAAYLAIMLPLVLALGLNRLHETTQHTTRIAHHILHISQRNLLIATSLFLIAMLFYIDIIYTGSQSGFLGTIAALGTFTLGYLFLYWKTQQAALTVVGSILGVCLVIAFFLGQPIGQLNRLTLPEIQKQWQQTTKQQNNTPTNPQAPQSGTALEGTIVGGTDSGTIRKNVWSGALAMWQAYPLFGTGVETFAFAYYQYRPAAHNMTSEWDYLYNKAHNEYLNYLSTSGIFGLGFYLLMIVLFLWIAVQLLLAKMHENKKTSLLLLALLAGYISMLVSNFFGFSVVIVNLYLFLIPALFFLLGKKLTPQTSLFPSLTHKAATASPPPKKQGEGVSSIQWISIIVVWSFTIWQLWTLTTFWVADQAFALAQNLNRVGQYTDGATKIREALSLRSDEPVFLEELATSDAVIAVALAQQKQEDVAKKLTDEAVTTITALTTQYPHNINFLKSQVRIYYTLSERNPEYLKPALETMQKLEKLAPTDAKISYNLGVLYGQTGNTQKGIDTLEKTIKLKPDYRDAYFALGLFYRDLAVEPNTTRVANQEMQQKAMEYMQKTLQFNKNDKAVLDTLKSWGER